MAGAQRVIPEFDDINHRLLGVWQFHDELMAAL
jgi:hypothetical protein